MFVAIRYGQLSHSASAAGGEGQKIVLWGRLTSHPHSEEAGELAVSAHPVKWLSVVMRKDHLESSYSLIFLVSIIIKARCIQHDYVANSVCGHELGREAAAAVQAVR